jgi:GTPase SAR1 family protein
MEHLATEVSQPCVVAVVGKVKAGKSTFINALLGDDLAKVGPTETTATINYFRYGIPHPDYPVRCYWRSGNITDETRKFLDDLQGNDLETLHRADSVDHLEYHVQNRHLEQIILVDTPGTGAVVEEHQNRTAEFLQLYRQLRERHDQETQHIGSKADAVIYLIGEITRASDQAFLDEFRLVTQGQARSLNAIGVMAKIDLNPEIIVRREELAKKIAVELQSNLNVVIPVSAGIQRALDSLLAQDQAGLKQFVTTLRRIPSETLDEILSDAELYVEMDCPVSPAERKQVRGEMLWKVFTTIASVAANSSLDLLTIVEELQIIAGFDRLREVLDQHFIRRGSLLRSYRIVNDALKVLNIVKFEYLPATQRREAEDTVRRKRLLAFILQVQQVNPVAARELETFIWEHLSPRADLRTVVEEMEREIGRIKYELEDYNTDFEALVLMENDDTLFTQEELHELQSLFGLYGLEVEKRLPLPLELYNTLTYLGKRQRYWEQKSQQGRRTIVRTVAQQAVRRYGLIVDALLQNTSENDPKVGQSA